MANWAIQQKANRPANFAKNKQSEAACVSLTGIGKQRNYKSKARVRQHLSKIGKKDSGFP